MKQINFSKLLEGAKTTLLRFPLVLLVAFIGTFSAKMIHVEGIDQYWKFLYFKIFILSAIGISLCFSLALMAERKILKINGLLAQFLGILALVGYFFVMPTQKESMQQFWNIQLILFFMSAHLLVAYAPYLNRLNINGFWQYNKALFINILTSLLYTYVLYLGLHLALFAINELFSIEIEWKTYYNVFLFLQGIFNTWFFLSKVPKNFDELNESDDFPIGLKIFSQYVLLPLVCIYLLILYFYGGKILGKMSLPIGWVSYLVIAFSVLGIFCFLLLYPFGKKIENAWIAKFNRWFYLLILPLVALLFVAIGYRINAYGLTENRYFVALIGLWLLGISLYFIFSKKDNIALIPMSLSALLFLSSMGFWGAYSMSLRNQKANLKAQFTKYGINTSNNPVNRTFLRTDAAQIGSIVSYFYERNETQSLYECYQPSDTRAIDTLIQYQKNSAFLKLIKVPEINNYYYGSYESNVKSKSDSISFSGKNNSYDYSYYRNQNNKKITGFDFLTRSEEVADNKIDSIFFRQFTDYQNNKQER